MTESTPSMAITFDQKEVAQMQASVPKLLEQAEELEVRTAEDYDASSSMLDVIVERKSKITNFFEEPAKQAHGLHKFITTLRNTLLEPLERGEVLLKDRRREYRAEMERQRLAKEEEERRKAKEEADAAALEQATTLAEMGEEEAANVIIDRAATAPPPPVYVPSMVPKQKGKSITKVWKFRIKSPQSIKREFIVPEDPYDVKAYPKIKALVDKLGPDAAAIVGIGSIEVYPGEVETVRRKA